MDLTNKLKLTMKQMFQSDDSLNNVEQEAIDRIFKGNRDVIITGFNSPMCYQLPVLLKRNAFAIVISSSVSYIKTQYNYLQSKRIETNFLTSETSRNKRNIMEKNIISATSDLKFVFITPRQYETSYFKVLLKTLKKERLSCIVIYKADMVVSEQEYTKQWYQMLDLKMVKVPIVALSTTRGSEVEKDIMRILKLKNPLIFAMPILRIHNKEKKKVIPLLQITDNEDKQKLQNKICKDLKIHLERLKIDTNSYYVKRNVEIKKVDSLLQITSNKHNSKFQKNNMPEVLEIDLDRASVDRHMYHTKKHVEIDKKKMAGIKLDKIYEKLYGQKKCEASTPTNNIANDWNNSNPGLICVKEEDSDDDVVLIKEVKQTRKGFAFQNIKSSSSTNNNNKRRKLQ